MNPYGFDTTPSCVRVMGKTFMKTVCISALALIMFIGCRQDAAPVRPWHQALYAAECPDFNCYDEVERVLPLLMKTRTDIYIAIPSWKIGDPSLKSLLISAKANGVGVRAWILLPQDKGYWPNEKNVEEFSKAVMNFVNWSDTESLGVSWIVVDLEPSFDYTQKFSDLLAHAQISEALALLKSHTDPKTYSESKEKFRSLISELHGRGWKVLAVTYPMILDDLADGDEGLQDALDIPCSGLDWDNISFMAYLSTFQSFVPDPVGADLVYSYAKDARKYFGDRGGIALGVVGPGGVAENQIPVYKEPGLLRRDFGATMLGGIREIQVYSLEGILALKSPEDWLGIYTAPQVVPRGETATQMVRGIMTSLDSSL